MDGYAARSTDFPDVPTALRVIGTSAAGHALQGQIGPGEAVRIFTGAPLPPGADCDGDPRGYRGARTERRREGEPRCQSASSARPGLDFKQARTSHGRIPPGRRAARSRGCHGTRTTRRARRRPRVADSRHRRRTGQAGRADGPGSDRRRRIPTRSLAIVEKAGGEAVDLGIAADTFEALENRIVAARSADADLLVTLGGASVGEHDLVQSALTRQGMSLGFWRVALRPGKPLMHGRLGSMLLLGLPGNPVSSIVCAILFLVPAIRAMLGDPHAAADTTETALLGSDLPANDGRQDYLRVAVAQVRNPWPLVRDAPGRDASRRAGFVDAQHAGRVARAPGSSPVRPGCKGRRALSDHPARAVLLIFLQELSRTLAEHRGNSYPVLALFQNRSQAEQQGPTC